MEVIGAVLTTLLLVGTKTFEITCKVNHTVNSLTIQHAIMVPVPQLLPRLDAVDHHLHGLVVQHMRTARDNNLHLKTESAQSALSESQLRISYV